MHALFKVTDEALVSVSSGSNDELMERGDGSGDLPEDAILRQWGRRWLRVFRRKASVEESFITEVMAAATPVGTAPPPAPVAPAETGAGAETGTDGGVDAGAGTGADGDMDVAESQ